MDVDGHIDYQYFTCCGLNAELGSSLCRQIYPLQ